MQMTRTKRYSRLWLVGVVAALLALAQLGWGAATPAGAQEGDDCASRGLPPEQVGIQLYTYGSGGAIGDDGIEAVVEHMAEVGMTNIERYGGTFGLSFDDYAQVYADNGVTATANHGSLDPAGFADVIAQQQQLGAEFIGSAGVGDPGYGTLEDTLQTAENLDALGEQAAAAGLRLFVHNHGGEVSTVYDHDLDGDGDTEQASAIEIILAETNPDWVSWEMDVHWTRHGLADLHGHDIDSAANQEALRDLAAQWSDRIPLLHVKDTAPDGDFANVGEGTTNWAAFFETVPNVDYYFIEYDGPPDPYHTAEVSFEYLTCGLYDSGDQSVAVTVPEEVDPGEFLWTIQGDGSVNLGEMADQGTYLQATGPIDPISVTDTRPGGPTWSISGQVSDFDPGGLGGNHLGWTPQVLTEGAGATAGAAVASGIDGGDGLSVPATLASAEDGHEAGTGLVGADLDLRFPVETDPGEYTATLTITALS